MKPTTLRLAVHFGALSAPLAEQLGVSGEQVHHLQQDANAIARLAVRGVLPESQVHAARKRLMRRITATVTEIRNDKSK